MSHETRKLVGIVAPWVFGINGISEILAFALVLVVQGLSKGLPGVDIRILDVYTTVNEVVAHPETYGFLNATDACIIPNQPPFKCAKPDTFVFWDGTHPTTAFHAIVAQQAIAVISAP